MTEISPSITNSRSLDPTTELPEYFKPLIDILETLDLKHNYSYAISNCLNNIMNIKIEILKQEISTGLKDKG